MNILCCDWGTSSFRLRLVNSEDYSVLAELQSADGVAGLYRSWQQQDSADRFSFYAEKLRSLIRKLSKDSGLESLDNTPVVVSGMASSSIGMEEIPYAPLPFAADGSQASVKIVENFNGSASLILVSGTKSENDVMRGEEAQLLGLFCLPEVKGISGKDSVFIFPGTHSKHIFVSEDNIIDFRTYMTGEVYNILSEYSILKDSIIKNSDIENVENIAAFKKGVELSLNSNLLNSIFTVRTSQLFSRFTREENAFYLSGLLIGTELSGLIHEDPNHIIICSGRHLYAHYKAASKVLDLNENITFIEPELIDKATIAGQVQIFKSLGA